MNLYDHLRLFGVDIVRRLGFASPKNIEKTLAEIERDEVAARKRWIEQASKIREKRGNN